MCLGDKGGVETTLFLSSDKQGKFPIKCLLLQAGFQQKGLVVLYMVSSVFQDPFLFMIVLHMDSFDAGNGIEGAFP